MVNKHINSNIDDRNRLNFIFEHSVVSVHGIIMEKIYYY